MFPNDLRGRFGDVGQGETEPSFPKEGVECVGGTWLGPAERTMVNVSGVDTEPLWVDPKEVAAVGMRGPDDTAIVLLSGTTIIAKGTHPNQVVFDLSVNSTSNEPDS